MKKTPMKRTNANFQLALFYGIGKSLTKSPENAQWWYTQNHVTKVAVLYNVPYMFEQSMKKDGWRVMRVKKLIKSIKICK